MRKVFRHLKFEEITNENTSIEQLNYNKNCRFLPENICGLHQLYLDGKSAEISYELNKDIITCIYKDEKLEPGKKQEFQILKFNYFQNKCLTRKMMVNEGEDEFVTFYFDKKRKGWCKILSLEFSSFLEAEKHRLPIDFYKAKDFNWKWCVSKN